MLRGVGPFFDGSNSTVETMFSKGLCANFLSANIEVGAGLNA
jgi:hypothetical protein